MRTARGSWRRGSWGPLTLLLGGQLVLAAGGAAASEDQPLSAQSERLGEYEAALSSEEVMNRMLAVKGLAALASDIGEPARLRSLLETARDDPDANVALQAAIELARLGGIDLVAPAVRTSHRQALLQRRAGELRILLASREPMDRLRALDMLSAMIIGGDALPPVEIRSLLVAASSDPDPNVALQASVELARMDGIDLVSPEVRAAHRLARERAAVDEYEALLGSAAMEDRLWAVKALSTMADDAREPGRVLSLLEAARSDPDRDVSEQARVSIEGSRSRRGD